MSEMDIQGFLMGGGVAAKFPVVGHVFEGTITGLRMQQQRDYDTGKPMFWDDGNKRMQLLVTLATDARGTFDEDGQPKEVPNDDGERIVYVKGAMQKALARALRDAQVKVPEVGGYFKVKRIANLPKVGNKKPAYNYAVQYTVPAENSKATEEFMTSDPETGGQEAKSDDPWAE